MDVQDTVFTQLFHAFVEAGGLDQTGQIVDEDWERIERQAAFCKHGFARRTCTACPARPLPIGMGGYQP